MQNTILQALSRAEEVLWLNPNLRPAAEALQTLPFGQKEADDAAARLQRFAPYIEKCFPETIKDSGLIESPLTEIPNFAKAHGWEGRVLLKRDSDLAVAGSVKARGGIYEVLKHAEILAMDAGILKETDNYAKLTEHRDFFSRYSVAVGSTGNLGLSIGIMSAQLGFRVTVHMSADAKQWKKDLLRSKGVDVREYAGDYSLAVENGRKESEADPMSYFVDDENSKDLFFGYCTAARRLEKQLREQNIPVDAEHPLTVTIPCGVGGAPGGIAFGLKLVFCDNVRIYFAEPTQCPCMLLGLATGKHEKISVQDIGLTGVTHADGLAVGRPSGFVGSVINKLLSGIFTVEDFRLYDLMRQLTDTEGIFIEPSACAALHALDVLPKDGTHILWATGGSLVPQAERIAYQNTYLEH